MALRVALSVVLALALLAVALPAVDDARTARSAASLDATSDRVRATVESLVASSDPVADGPTARRTVLLDPPTRGWGARAGALRLRDRHVGWRVAAGPWHERRVPSLVVPDGPLVVRGPARLTLSHRLVGGRSAAVVERGLKSEGETTAGHDPARTPA